MSPYLLPFHITIFTLVLIILLNPKFSNCQFQFSFYPLRYFLLGYLYSLLRGFLSLVSIIYPSSLIFSASSSLLLSCFIVCFQSFLFVHISHPPIPYSHVRIICIVFATSLIFHYHHSFTIFPFSESFFIRIILPLFFPSDISATIFFPLLPFEHTLPSPSPLPPSSCHLLQAAPHQPHVCTIAYRRV